MKKTMRLETILSVFAITAMMFAITSCIGDQSAAKKRGTVKDFSTNTSGGCGDSYLIYNTAADTCITTCATGTHIATVDELSEVKKDLVAKGNTTLLGAVNGSAGLCIEDPVVELRPTNAITIKSDFCSCVNGKSDIISDCAAICATKPSTTTPTLYVNTLIGPEIALNTKLGNLYNWCTIQLADDETSPRCVLRASDGTNSFDLDVNLTRNSNNFSVNVNGLTIGKTWILKLVESMTGTNAQSASFQIKRKVQTDDSNTVVGALKITPVSQYTCMTFGGKVDGTGNIIRTTFARIFYYFAAESVPPPIEPPGGTNQSQILCHDENQHPGNDNALYPRLELVPGAFSMWDMTDPRFVKDANGEMAVNASIKKSLLEDYNVTSQINLFTMISYPNRPSTTSSTTTNPALGFLMIPFVDANGKAYCPVYEHLQGDQPLFQVLKNFIPETEGLFLGEKEAETVQDGSGYKTLYGTMFVRESIIKQYGFYLDESGTKVAVKLDPTSIHRKTIFYYWPIINDPAADPLLQVGRKLYTVRRPSELNGQSPTGQPVASTSDKRIGCVPKI